MNPDENVRKAAYRAVATAVAEYIIEFQSRLSPDVCLEMRRIAADMAAAGLVPALDESPPVEYMPPRKDDH